MHVAPISIFVRAPTTSLQSRNTASASGPVRSFLWHVFGIFGPSYETEVIQPIVELVSVDVVDL